MENIAIVVNKSHPDSVPFGFWAMNDERVENLEYIVGHNNEEYGPVYRIIAAFKVSLEKDIHNPRDGWKGGRWCFKLELHDSEEVLNALPPESELYGVRGVRYTKTKDARQYF